jgi:arsenate reductase-like glutaredoxin family protein
VIVSFEDLQELSGCRQVNKVVSWLESSKIPHVVGSDGKPRTTQEWLNRWIERGQQNATTQVRFKI